MAQGKTWKNDNIYVTREILLLANHCTDEGEAGVQQRENSENPQISITRKPLHPGRWVLGAVT